MSRSSLGHPIDFCWNAGKNRPIFPAKILFVAVISVEERVCERLRLGVGVLDVGFSIAMVTSL